jgi:hypothetical protein
MPSKQASTSKILVLFSLLIDGHCTYYGSLSSDTCAMSSLTVTMFEIHCIYIDGTGKMDLTGPTPLIVAGAALVGDGAALVGDGAAAVAQRLEVEGAAAAHVTRVAGREARRRRQRARAVVRDIERVLKHAMIICQHSEQQMTNLAVALPDRLSAAGAVLLGHLLPPGEGLQRSIAEKLLVVGDERRERVPECSTDELGGSFRPPALLQLLPRVMVQLHQVVHHSPAGSRLCNNPCKYNLELARSEVSSAGRTMVF